ncbi:MAG: hypothetical protein ACJ75S_11380 [Solirubrobacterales bacterium]
MSATLVELRAEHEREVIGPQLASLLARIATATAKTYPPDYSAAGVWDDAAIEDVLQDWTEDRLLRRKDLGQMLAGARSLGALRAALTTSLGQHLTNRRRRSAATNLYKRTLAMLRSSERFASADGAGVAADQPWQIKGTSESGPSPMRDAELVRLAFQLSDEELGVVRYGPHSLKESPILRREGLHRFLEHVLGGAGGTLTPAILIEVMKRRFNLLSPAPVELEEAEQLEQRVAPPVTEAVAASVVARLGRRRSELLVAFAAHGEVEAAAQSCGVEPAVLERALSEAMALIAEYAADPEEAEAIYSCLREKLFGGSE